LLHSVVGIAATYRLRTLAKAFFYFTKWKNITKKWKELRKLICLRHDVFTSVLIGCEPVMEISSQRATKWLL